MLLACKSTDFARQSHCFFKGKKWRWKRTAFLLGGSEGDSGTILCVLRL